jgi:hypothetical protein
VSQNFKELESSFLRSQELSTCTHPEPDQSKEDSQLAEEYQEPMMCNEYLISGKVYPVQGVVF